MAHSRRGRMDPQQKRLKVQPAGPAMTISPSTTQRAGQDRAQRLGQLGEIAVERLQVAALDGRQSPSRKTIARKPSHLGSIQPALSRGGCLGPAWPASARGAARRAGAWQDHSARAPVDMWTPLHSARASDRWLASARHGDPRSRRGHGRMCQGHGAGGRSGHPLLHGHASSHVRAGLPGGRCDGA